MLFVSAFSCSKVTKMKESGFSNKTEIGAVQTSVVLSDKGDWSDEKITWSTARSSFISRMVDEGYHPLQIAEQVGNSPNTIYKHYYTNTQREKVKEHMNRVL